MRLGLQENVDYALVLTIIDCLSQGYARELGQAGKGCVSLIIHQDHMLNELI
jgi:hypothetical protein